MAIPRRLPHLLAPFCALFLLSGCHSNTVWSPDSKQIVLDMRGVLTTFEVATHKFTQRTQAPARALNPAWAPDSKRIAYYRATVTSGNMLQTMSLMSLSLATGRSTPVVARLPVPTEAPGKLPSFGTMIAGSVDAARESLGITWSPDGKRLAFCALAGTDTTLWVSNADGAGAHAILPKGSNVLAPAWSPDGAQIAYLTKTGIKLVKPDGTGGKLLFDFATHPGLSPVGPAPTWFPDGKSLGVVLGVSDETKPSPFADRAEYWRVPADGSAPVRLGEFNGIPMLGSVAADASGVGFFITPAEAKNGSQEPPKSLELGLLTDPFKETLKFGSLTAESMGMKPGGGKDDHQQVDSFPVLSISPDLTYVALGLEPSKEPADLLLQSTSGGALLKYRVPLPLPKPKAPVTLQPVRKAKKK